MILTASAALTWTEKLIALAIALQSMELLQIRATFSDQGIWRWETLKADFELFPAPVQKALELLLRYPNFVYLLVARCAAALALVFFPHPDVVFILLATQILVSLRWRGTFNGGSDFMTLIVVTAVFIASLFRGNPAVVSASLGYIAIQACTSYFIAGVIKLRRANWRSGRALAGFLQSSVYGPDPLLGAVSRPPLAQVASWSVMLFECSFPLALANPQICGAFLALSLFFHLACFHAFGLNRFLFAWAAAYPALYFCSQLRG